MGKIQAGILSKVSGKVAGVVGAGWKDVAYLRAYTIPANPNTAAQQTQRTLFKQTVDFCKPLVGQVFNAYTDKFIKSMSGFNFFIKRNIAHFGVTPDYGSVLMTEGPLSTISNFSVIYSGAIFTFNWTENLGNNGESTDKVFGCLYHKPTGVWTFFENEEQRSDLSVAVTLTTGLTAEDFECWMWAIKYQGTVLDMISNSLQAEAEDA